MSKTNGSSHDNKRNLANHNHVYEWVRLMGVTKKGEHSAIYTDLWKCKVQGCGELLTTTTEGYI